MPNLQNVAKGDSNPGSLDCESHILPLSYRAPYNIPLGVAFVDYEKAFYSVQTQAILASLQEQGIEDMYIEILKDIYIRTTQ